MKLFTKAIEAKAQAQYLLGADLFYLSPKNIFRLMKY